MQNELAKQKRNVRMRKKRSISSAGAEEYEITKHRSHSESSRFSEYIVSYTDIHKESTAFPWMDGRSFSLSLSLCNHTEACASTYTSVFTERKCILKGELIMKARERFSKEAETREKSP